MKVYLIRHGATRGNLERRYVGETDEELTSEGRVLLQEKLWEWKKWREGQGKGAIDFLKADRVFVSPLKRCRQTAEILYPGREQIVIEDLRECSFGEFEYKNYEELQGNSAYQRFIDSMGESGFPGGETLAAFQERCVRAFEQVIDERASAASGAFVVHGGTIMAILDRFSVPHKNYYEWQAGNGEGFSASVIADGEGFYLGDIERLWQQKS